MNCPHCGSPVPLGSTMCFDCGARIPSAERDPWDFGEEKPSRVLRNTGERTYARDQRRQAFHERMHELHAVSSEAASSDYEHAQHHPAAARPRPAHTNAQKPGSARNQKKANSSGMLVPVVIFILIMLFSCAAEL